MKRTILAIFIVLMSGLSYGSEDLYMLKRKFDIRQFAGDWCHEQYPHKGAGFHGACRSAIIAELAQILDYQAAQACRRDGVTERDELRACVSATMQGYGLNI